MSAYRDVSSRDISVKTKLHSECGGGHSAGWGHRLDQKEEASRALAFIPLCFLTVDAT